MQTRQLGALLCLMVLMGPLIGSLSVPSPQKQILDNGVQYLSDGQTLDVPEQDGYGWITDLGPWWDRSSLDLDRNKIHDSLQTLTIPTGIGLSYSTEVTDAHLNDLSALGLNVVDVIESVDAVLLGVTNTSLIYDLADLEDVVMVERYGEIHLYGDIQTQL